ncbi:TIGR03936 family radical SAM-associated protein [Clostridium sp.]|uniref:TIGR03936 family radical SAM-associated protein n=1 Tax=Clostridium sp. TaxID=1506 RepID=UPI002FC63DF0
MKVRYLIKYSKESEIKFISHLDLMRTIQRIIRRAGIPIEYSKGFNPHMAISIAQPLSVGVYSIGEYMDIVLKEDIDTEVILNKLNENSPSGVRFIDVTKVEKNDNSKAPQAMAIIDGARYLMKFRSTNNQRSLNSLEELHAMPQWNIVKKSKSGEKEVDIKPLIKEFRLISDKDTLEFETLVACGSRENLSASLLGDFIKENVEAIDKDAFIDIERIDMYAYKGNALVPLNKFF